MKKLFTLLIFLPVVTLSSLTRKEAMSQFRATLKKYPNWYIRYQIKDYIELSTRNKNGQVFHVAYDFGDYYSMLIGIRIVKPPQKEGTQFSITGNFGNYELELLAKRSPNYANIYTCTCELYQYRMDNLFQCFEKSCAVRR